MNARELTEEALRLPKREKAALVNALLQSMSGRKADDERKMPVYQALHRFDIVYRRLKGTSVSVCTQARNFASMRRLLVAISQKMSERPGADPDAITDDALLASLEAFMNAVAAMQNKWYFNNRFTVTHLADDFETLYPQLKNNDGHERARRAFDYL